MGTGPRRPRAQPATALPRARASSIVLASPVRASRVTPSLLLLALTAGCGHTPRAEEGRALAPPTPTSAATPAPSTPAPSPTEAPTLTVDEFVARTVSKAGAAVFVRGRGAEEEVSCEGFELCGRYCLDGALGRPCSEATHKLACRQAPVYAIPTAAEQARLVECSADGAQCSVEHEGVHNPAYPAPRFRDTFFFDASGTLIGFARSAVGEPPTLDPVALHRLAEKTCAYRAALEAKSLEPVERIGLRSSAAADLAGEQPSDLEEHLCGEGVPALVRRVIDDVVESGGFDGCRLGEGTLFTCWVYGTEAWTLYHAENVGTEAEPRFALFAISTEGRALDDAAQAAETAATAEFLERTRAGSTRRVGRVPGFPASARRDVRNCR